MNSSMNIDDIDQRFFVHGRMEILNILNDLILREEPVTVHFGDGAGRLLTRLLEARDKTLIFELGSDLQANQQLQQCPACSFAARPDGIHVRFAAGQVQQISWGDSSAFCVPLPDRLARLQRQESLRVLIPAQTAIAVQLFSEDGASLGQYPLHDLSVGGVGLAVDSHARVTLEQKLSRVHFLLPDHGTIDCAVSLRHATGLAPVQEANHPCRIGASFSGLKPEARAAIQRYIIQIEHDRHSAAMEYEPDDNADDNY